MAANALAFAVQFGINFFLTPYIVSTLGSEAYGFIPLVNNIIGYAAIITVALDSISARFITIEITRGNTTKANAYFNSVLLADTILALAMLLPSALFMLNMNGIIDIPPRLIADVQLTFFFAFITFFINLVFAVIGCCYYVKNRVDLNAKRTIESNILRAAILITLFTLSRPHIYYIPLTTTLVAVFLIACNFHYSRKLTPELTIDPRRFSLPIVREMLSTGVWNSLNQLSSTLLTGLDLLLANMFLGAVQSGEYALVKTVPNFILQLVIMVLSAFVPEFNILYAKNRKKDLLDSVDFSLRIMGFLVTMPIGFLMVFGKEFFEAWVPGQDSSLLQGLSILTMVPLIAICGTESIVKIYTVTNRLRVPALVMIGMGCVNVVADLLILRYTTLGIWTLPIVSCAVNIVIQLVFTPIYGARCLQLKWTTFYASIFRGLSCSASVIIIGLVYRSLIRPHGWPALILAGTVCCTIAAAINLCIAFDARSRRKVLRLIAGRITKNA